LDEVDKFLEKDINEKNLLCPNTQEAEAGGITS
jgi:hypothetical protein